MRKAALTLAAASLWTLLAAPAYAASLPTTVPAPPPAGQTTQPAEAAPPPAAEPVEPAEPAEPAPATSLVTVFNDEIIEPINVPVSTCDNVLSKHSSTSCNAGAASATTVP